MSFRGAPNEQVQATISMGLDKSKAQEISDWMDKYAGNWSLIDRAVSSVGSHLEGIAKMGMGAVGLGGVGAAVNSYLQTSQLGSAVGLSAGYATGGENIWKPYGAGMLSAQARTGVAAPEIAAGLVQALQAAGGNPTPRQAAMIGGVLAGYGNVVGLTPSQISQVVSPLLEAANRTVTAQNILGIGSTITGDLTNFQGSQAAPMMGLISQLGVMHAIGAGPAGGFTTGLKGITDSINAAAGAHSIFRNPSITGGAINSISSALQNAYTNPQLEAFMNMAGLSYQQQRTGFSPHNMEAIMAEATKLYGTGTTRDIFLRSTFGIEGADMLETFSPGSKAWRNLNTQLHSHSMSRAALANRIAHAQAATTPQATLRKLEGRLQGMMYQNPLLSGLGMAAGMGGLSLLKGGTRSLLRRLFGKGGGAAEDGATEAAEGAAGEGGGLGILDLLGGLGPEALLTGGVFGGLLATEGPGGGLMTMKGKGLGGLLGNITTSWGSSLEQDRAGTPGASSGGRAGALNWGGNQYIGGTARGAQQAAAVAGKMRQLQQELSGVSSASQLSPEQILMYGMQIHSISGMAGVTSSDRQGLNRLKAALDASGFGELQQSSPLSRGGTNNPMYTQDQKVETLLQQILNAIKGRSGGVSYTGGAGSVFTGLGTGAAQAIGANPYAEFTALSGGGGSGGNYETGTTGVGGGTTTPTSFDTGAGGGGATYSQAQLQQLWVANGGSATTKVIASAIAMAESHGEVHATNRDGDGTVDRGLWQINSCHGAQSTYDPNGNCRSAIAISSNGTDWSAWTTFTSGAYLQFMPGGGNPRASKRAGGGGAARLNTGGTVSGGGSTAAFASTAQAATQAAAATGGAIGGVFQPGGVMHVHVYVDGKKIQKARVLAGKHTIV